MQHMTLATALLAAIVWPGGGMAEDAGSAAGLATAPATAPAVAPAPAPQAPAAAPRRRVRRRVPVKATVKASSIMARLDAIERKLDMVPLGVSQITASPFAVTQERLDLIRVGLKRYGEEHRAAQGFQMAGYLVRNVTWATGLALAGIGYADALRADRPRWAEFQLVVIGGAIIGGGQFIGGVLDVMGMARERNAGLALKRITEPLEE